MLNFFKLLINLFSSINFSQIINNLKFISSKNKKKSTRKSNKLTKNSSNNELDDAIPSTIIITNNRIVFTVKGFIGTMTGILGVFYGFYLIVVVPRLNNIETVNSNNYKYEVIRINLIQSEINELIEKNAILTTKVNNLNDRLDRKEKRLNDKDSIK